MMREYLFCSVMESQQMARRSPLRRTSCAGCGAGSGLKGANSASEGLGGMRLAAVENWPKAARARHRVRVRSADFRFIMVTVCSASNAKPVGTEADLSNCSDPKSSANSLGFTPMANAGSGDPAYMTTAVGRVRRVPHAALSCRSAEVALVLSWGGGCG